MKRLKLLLKQSDPSVVNDVLDFLSRELPHQYTTERFDGRVSIYIPDQEKLSRIESRYPGIIEDVKNVY